MLVCPSLSGGAGLTSVGCCQPLLLYKTDPAKREAVRLCFNHFPDDSSRLTETGFHLSKSVNRDGARLEIKSRLLSGECKADEIKKRKQVLHACCTFYVLTCIYIVVSEDVG